MTSLSAIEKALCEVAGERAADTILATMRPPLLALLAEHKALDAAIRAGLRHTSGTKAWTDLLRAHEEAAEQVSALVRTLEDR